MSQIQVKNLSFGYQGSYENVFENVSFNIDTDWKLGLIGRNGKGKTTFLKLLLNEYNYQGKIEKSVEFDYFPFEIKDEKNKTLDIINEIALFPEEWKIYKELNLINADAEILYRSFNVLSGGEKVKALLVALFLKENNFLLIDEPTNHLGYESKKEVEKYLNDKKGFIVVSHDREFLDNVADHIISINNKNIDIQKGNYSSWKENKERQDNFELAENNKLKKDIKRLEESEKRAAKWSNDIEKTKYGSRNSGLRPDRGYIGHQSAKMMQRSKSIENRKNKEIQEKESLLKNVDVAHVLTMKPLQFRKKEIIYASNLQIKYDNKHIFQKLNFDINVGDRVLISGENGSGKTSLINLILGENIEYDGEIKIAYDLKISYVEQHTDKVKGNLREYALKYQIDEGIFKAMLSKLGVESKEFEKDIQNMSEGQKKKVLIARSITESADLYVWDEPLNYIDIISREQIEEMILKYKPTIIFVEHDKIFGKKIANKIIEISK